MTDHAPAPPANDTGEIVWIPIVGELGPDDVVTFYPAGELERVPAPADLFGPGVRALQVRGPRP